MPKYFVCSRWLFNLFMVLELIGARTWLSAAGAAFLLYYCNVRTMRTWSEWIEGTEYGDEKPPL